MTAALAASWSSLLRYAHAAADDFWCAVEQRCPGRLPEREAAVFLAALGRLAGGGDDPAGRAALLAVLGHAYRRYRLLPHQAAVEAALTATVARHTPGTPELAAAWAVAARRASAAVTPAVARAGGGPAWWPAEVIDHDRPADGVAILTVRPWRRLPFRPGQAVPVCTGRWPGRWRWFSPASAPRPDGTVELHVRAVAAVSRALVHARYAPVIRSGSARRTTSGWASTRPRPPICCWWPGAPASRRCAPSSNRSPQHRPGGG